MHNLVKWKWIFHTKSSLNGSVDRYETWLVAKGFHQWLSFDYHDTFNPVVKPTTIRFVLNIAIGHGWSLCQLDVNNVFLQGNLFEDVFMAQPLGFIGCNHLDHMCKLPKAIYGLKQVPHA